MADWEDEAATVDLEADPLQGRPVQLPALGTAVSPAPPARTPAATRPAGSQPKQPTAGELQQLEALWARVQLLGSPQAVDATADAEFQAQLAAILPDAERFQAGGFGRQALMWERYFQLAASSRAGPGVRDGAPHPPLSKTQKWLVKALKEGVRLDWVPVYAPCQRGAPDRRKKAEVVWRMLSAALGSRDPAVLQPYLQGDRPSPVQRFVETMKEHQGFSAEALNETNPEVHGSPGRAEGDLHKGCNERDEHRGTRLANDEAAENRCEQPERGGQPFKARCHAKGSTQRRVGKVSGEEDDTAGDTDNGCDNDVNNAPSEAIGGGSGDGCVHLRAPFMNGNEGTGCEMSPPCAGITQIRFDGRTL